ncbi:MAG: heme lyase CcmF/NrfE family subunit [Alphaproteobacteria bacterium]
MTTEIGHFALLLALVVAVVQAVLPLLGAVRGDGVLIAVARPAAVVQFLCVAGAFAVLTHAYVVSDFSVANVAANSHTDKPMLYKVSGVWGNHEGSMLLWVATLALFGMAVAVFGRGLPPRLQARVLSVQALIAVGFLSFIIFTSNPFLRLPDPPLNGNGLNPLLQDPGLAFHPPFLYLGYVGFSMAFSFAIAALMEGRVDAAWARWVRPWTLAAWSFLTLGIATGSWWAYYTLGWGGWWYWDPVENASFMPWLAGTALLHSVIVVEKRNALKSWTILLAILTFALSLLGTFLVRSGVITSVHSFASDPGRGVFILALLTLTIGAALTLYAVRARSLVSGSLFAPASREGSLVLNNALMSAAAGSVLLGTLYPLFIEVFDLGKISVGPPFYNSVFLPLMVPMIAVMALGPFLSWKRAVIRAVLWRARYAAAAAAVTAVVTAVLGPADGPWWAPAGLALASWLLVATATEWHRQLEAGVSGGWLQRLKRLPRSVHGMALAHTGLAMVIAGIVGSSAWKIERLQTMRTGDTVEVAGYQCRFDGVTYYRGPNFDATQADVSVSRNGREVTFLKPERRQYWQPPRSTTVTSIHADLFGDLYAALGEPDGNGGHVTRFYYNPMVLWWWVGALAIVGGGVVSITDRRRRVGTPGRKRHEPAAVSGSM